MRIGWIRQRLDAAIVSGLALAGCSDRAIEGGHEASAGGGSEGTSTSGSVSTSTTTSMSSSTSTTMSMDSGEAEVESGSPPHFDVGGVFDTPSEPGVLDCEQIPELPESGCVGTNVGGGL